MTHFIAAVAGVTLAGGILAIGAGLRRVPPAPPRPKRARTSLFGTKDRAAASRTAGLAGLIIGLLVAVSTGWLIAVILLPLAAAAIPSLAQGSHGRQQITKLEALGEWTRSLEGVLSAGVGLDQGIQATLSRSTPAAIRPHIASLVARIRAGWSTSTALRAFADELDDPTADTVVAGLILAASRPGRAGVSAMLTGIAERADEDIRNRRQIEAALATPRTTVRWLTILTPVFAIIMVLIQRDWMSIYANPLGQAYLLLLLLAYGAILIWLRRVSRGRPQGRLLGTAAADDAHPDRTVVTP